MLRCQVCGEEGPGRGAWVRCSRCDTPHHRDCWDFARRCSTFACGSARPVPLDDAPGPVVSTELVIGDEAADEDTPATGGAPAPLPAGEARDVRGQAVDLAAPRTVLDLDTPLETLLWVIALVTVLFAIGVLLPPRGHEGLTWTPDWSLALTLGVVALAAGILRALVSSYYVLDNEARRVLDVFEFGRFSRIRDRGGFDDVLAVTSQAAHQYSKHATWWEYRVVLVTGGGTVIPVSDWTGQLPRVRGLARNLALHLGARHDDAPPEQVLRVRRRGGKLLVQHVPPGFLERYPRLTMALVVLVGMAAVFAPLLYLVL